jgi:hypothetical protein
LSELPISTAVCCDGPFVLVAVQSPIPVLELPVLLTADLAAATFPDLKPVVALVLAVPLLWVHVLAMKSRTAQRQLDRLGLWPDALPPRVVD